MSNITAISLGIGAFGTLASAVLFYPGAFTLSTEPKPFTYKWFFAYSSLFYLHKK